MTDPNPSTSPSGDTHGALKASLGGALMIPVAVAIIAGGYVSLSDLATGLPLLATGVVLLIFNIVLLKVLFARLHQSEAAGAEDQKDQD